MKEKTDMNNSSKVLIFTVFIGALGSGVWESFLKPLFSFVIMKASDFLSTVSSLYSDTIYKIASNLETNEDPMSIAAWVAFFLGLYWFMAAFKETEIYRRLHFDRFKKDTTPFSKKISVVVYAIGTLLMLSVCIQNFSIKHIRDYVSKNLCIIRPYVGDVDYHTLRSDFARMKNEEDFEKFLVELYNRFETHDLPIEKYESE